MSEQFGNYEILRKLAAGGMAEVFLAKHRSLGGFERLVCIKRILPHLSKHEDFIKMFQDEARIVANMVHPNIAQIYDIGQLEDTYYIAMEYVRGEDLRHVYNGEVARGRAMPLEPAAHIAMGAASGLDYAHRQSSIDGQPLGIVHRDVSPQNILVTYDGHVKIIDFGVAKAEGKLNETRSGVLKGKYSYMSPEQASGEPIDGRTDIFALGITLYEITTGVRLFKRESELETLHAVIECNVAPPGELIPGYDEELQDIVLQALARDPDERFASAGDMERGLQGFLARRGHATTASSLGAYMHGLFAEKLADELLFGEPWEESPTPPPRAAPAGRLSPSRSGPLSASEPTSEPEVADVTAEDTEISQSAFTGTARDDQPENAPQRESGAVWGVPSDWDTSAEPVSHTQTQGPSAPAVAPNTDPREVAPEPAAGPSAPAVAPNADPREVAPEPAAGPSAPAVAPTMQFGPGPRPGHWFSYVALGALVVGISMAVGLVIASRRKDPSAAPRSGMLAIDSEPRGARVVFVGPGSDLFNRTYDGHRTPFTIVDGIPVENALRLRFIKDGYEVAEAELPALEADVVPEPVFVELSAGDHDATMATLVILSDPPGAEIWVDGTQVPGKTPLNDVHVPGGAMHEVELRLSRYRARRETVYVEPGSRRFIELQLFPTKETPAAEIPHVPDIELVKPAIVAPSERPPRKANPNRAYLTVTSPMKLEVSVDRRFLGETPVRKVAVDVGMRTVRIRSDREGFTLRRRVRFSPGRSQMLDIRPRKGKLALHAAPWAWVRVGRESPAETPVRLDVYEGEYNVVFECPDGRRKREPARVFPGQTTSVSVSCRD